MSKKIISTLVVICCALMISSNVFCADSGSTNFDSKATSKNVYQTVNDKTGSPEKLQQNFISPLLGQGQLSNIEGSKSFNAQVSCPSSTKFLEILMQPLGSGDVNFNVYYDSNFDGNIDTSFFASGVSGVCADGFIICQPGSWNNCNYYKFAFVNNVLSYTNVSLSELSGCFCINNYCGHNLAFRNAEYLLSVFGGGIVSAMQEARPQLAISKVQTDQVVIRYYGQDSEHCSVSKEHSQGFDDPTYLYDNPYSITNLAQTQMQSSSFTDLLKPHLTNTSEQSCSIRRIITEVKYDFTDVMSSSSSPQCPGMTGVKICGDNCLKFQMPIYISAGGTYYSQINFNMNLEMKSKISSGYIHWCTNTSGPYPCTDDDGWYRLYLNGSLFASGSYEDCEPCQHYKKIPISSLVDGQNIIKVYIGGAGGGQGVQSGCRIINVYLYFKVPLKGCYITDNYIEDNCHYLRQKASSGECKLKGRTQNGVVTIKDYHSTGLVPLIDCRNICEDVFCYDDWTIEETYECEANLPDYDFTRPQKVLQTMDYSGNTLSFNDVRLQNNQWVNYSDQNFNIALETGEACEQVCKVKVIEEEEDVGISGNEGKYNKDKVNVRYDFRECKDSHCPYDPKKGEELAEQCGCLTDFNEAVSAIQAIRMAGQDLICSSGDERSF